jgi:RNA polymerase sigma-70 factor (ECF subfamily)
MSTAHNTLQEIDAVYRCDARRVFATLVRLLGDFDLAEEALHEAFRAALEQWPAQGVPANPSAWLVSAGRFKAIDSIRRQARFTSTETMEQPLDAIADEAPPTDDASAELEDDSLRLIFTCCHPALAPDAQVALTLREVCGLTTEEIARAYLTPAPTAALCIVRAKAKIRDAKIPYRVPEADELALRMPSVLPSSPGAEIHGLLALMVLHESRRAARADAAGNLVPLEEQDRSAGLPPGPCGAGRFVPQTAAVGRGAHLLPGSLGTGAVGARTPVPGAAVGRNCKLIKNIFPRMSNSL